MIKPCPTCGESSSNYELVAVAEPEEPEAPIGFTEDPAGHSEAATFTETMCIRFSECGHAFEREDAKRVLDALRELRSLKREFRKTEDVGRAERLREYEIPLQRERVEALTNRMTRREDAEDIET